MNYENSELDLIDHILYRHKIYDIELEYDKWLGNERVGIAWVSAERGGPESKR